MYCLTSIQFCLPNIAASVLCASFCIIGNLQTGSLSSSIAFVFFFFFECGRYKWNFSRLYIYIYIYTHILGFVYNISLVTVHCMTMMFFSIYPWKQSTFITMTMRFNHKGATLFILLSPRWIGTEISVILSSIIYIFI